MRPHSFAIMTKPAPVASTLLLLLLVLLLRVMPLPVDLVSLHPAACRIGSTEPMLKS